MPPRTIAVALPLILALGLGTPALTQTPPPEESASIATELRRLDETLQAIRSLLERRLETDSLDLLLRRADLASTRAAQVESRLRSARSEVRSMEDQRARVTSQREILREQMRSADPEEAAELELVDARMSDELERLAERTRDVELEIGGLEGELARRHQEVREWQDLVDRRLGGS